MALLRRLAKPQVDLKDPTQSFVGRTVIVTGANSGLGFATAIKFAKLGVSHIILGVRSIEKGEVAKRAIQEQSRENEAIQIEVWPLDLLLYDSVRQFAARASNELPRLDVVILNAAVEMSEFQMGPHGWETILQVNTLSTALLGLLLLAKLKEGKQDNYTPVLEFVSSVDHRRVTFTSQQRSAANLLAVFNNQQAFQGAAAGHAQYGRSKFFLMCAVGELAQLALNSNSGKPDVYVTSICPGPTQTDMGRHYNSLFFKAVKAIIFNFFRTPEQGARTVVSGTLLGEKGHGEFWKDDIIHEKCDALAGESGKLLQNRVWQEIIDVLQAENPQVLGIAQRSAM